MPPKRKSRTSASGKRQNTVKKAGARNSKSATSPINNVSKATTVKKGTKRGAPTPSATDFSTMTVAQLKAECVKNGLETNGVKAALVKRLNDNVQNGGKLENSISLNITPGFYFFKQF